MNVNPGELNKQIEIVEIIKDENKKTGFSKKAETVIRKPYAKVSYLTIKEKIEATTEIKEIRCRFLVRFTRKPITSRMFVKYKGIYFEIEYAQNYSDSNEYIEILGKAVENNGRI